MCGLFSVVVVFQLNHLPRVTEKEHAQFAKGTASSFGNRNPTGADGTERKSSKDRQDGEGGGEGREMRRSERLLSHSDVKGVARAYDNAQVMD